MDDLHDGVNLESYREVVDRLRAENERYLNALIEIGEWDNTRTLGYEGPRDIALKALATDEESNDG